MKKNGLVVTWNVGSSSIKVSAWEGERCCWTSLYELPPFSSKTKQKFQAAVRHAQKKIDRLALPIEAHLHRIVFGGPRAYRPLRVSTGSLHSLQQWRDRDPLHLPAALAVIHHVKTHWPKATGWLLYDAFPYEHLPPFAREYALPRWLVEKYHIHRVGYHGLSHWSAVQQTARKQKKNVSSWSGVTVHLGSGSSITAWDHGQAIDTSMGFSPLSGPMMGTRSGDLDPLIPTFLVRHAGMTPARVEKVLTEESGLRGLTGSADVRSLLRALGHGPANWPKTTVTKKQATVYWRMLTYEVARYIGSYAELVSNVDAIVFTGGMGVNRFVQKSILGYLRERKKWQVFSWPADEERAMVKIHQSMLY